MSLKILLFFLNVLVCTWQVKQEYVGSLLPCRVILCNLYWLCPQKLWIERCHLLTVSTCVFSVQTDSTRTHLGIFYSIFVKSCTSTLSDLGFELLVKVFDKRLVLTLSLQLSSSLTDTCTSNLKWDLTHLSIGALLILCPWNICLAHHRTPFAFHA